MSRTVVVSMSTAGGASQLKEVWADNIGALRRQGRMAEDEEAWQGAVAHGVLRREGHYR